MLDCDGALGEMQPMAISFVMHDGGGSGLDHDFKACMSPLCDQFNVIDCEMHDNHAQAIAAAAKCSFGAPDSGCRVADDTLTCPANADNVQTGGSDLARPVSADESTDGSACAMALAPVFVPRGAESDNHKTGRIAAVLSPTPIVATPGKVIKTMTVKDLIVLSHKDLHAIAKKRGVKVNGKDRKDTIIVKLLADFAERSKVRTTDANPKSVLCAAECKRDVYPLAIRRRYACLYPLNQERRQSNTDVTPR